MTTSVWDCPPTPFWRCSTARRPGSSIASAWSWTRASPRRGGTFTSAFPLATTYKYILRLLLASKRYRAAWRFYLNNLRRDWPERGLLLLPLWNTVSFFADPLKPFWRRCAAAITPRPRARP